MMGNTYRNNSPVLFLMILIASCLLGAQAHAASLTLSADRDNSLLSTACCGGFNDTNLGTSESIQVGTAGGAGAETRTLISFDVSPLAGAYDSIDSITLRLYNDRNPEDISGETPFTIEVHEISLANADWLEGSGGNDDSTWDNKDEGTPTSWAGSAGLQTALTDYDTTILASNVFNALPADDSAVDFSFVGSSAALTSLIDGWLSTNPGMVLFSNPVPGGANKRLRFYSREETTSGTSAFIPQLIVEFTAPVPEPSSFLLLGVGTLGLVRQTRRRRRLS